MLTTNKSIAENQRFLKKLLELFGFFKISTLPSNCKNSQRKKLSLLYQLAFCSEAVPNVACVQLIILRRNGPVALTEGLFLSYFVLT